MHNQLIFVADLFLDNKSWGGAERDDEALLSYMKIPRERQILSQKLFNVEKDVHYLIGSFWQIPPRMLFCLHNYGTYSIYEHDHHYCRTRNPYVYSKDNIVPFDQKVFLPFYKGARNVFCMSTMHKKVLDKNLEANTIPITTSFWKEDSLKFIESLSRTTKNGKACIHNSDAQHKGRAKAIQFCQENNIQFELIDSTPSESAFLEKISKYSNIVFFAESPETFNRTLVEAKMMNVIPICNEELIGASSEKLWGLNGEILIDYIRNIAMPESIKIITERI